METRYSRSHVVMLARRGSFLISNEQQVRHVFRIYIVCDEGTA